MPEFSTPQLIITNAGLAAADQATPVGPFIHITKFQIGSAFGYTPTKDDLTINGELLFEGAPLTYKYVGDNTLDIVCRLPADAGPFKFGEVALLMDGDVMFAKAAFADAQIKYSSLGTNVLSTYTFNCLLKLDQAVAVFQINTNCLPPDIWEVDFWSDVYPPALSANPDIPAILVRELDENGNSSLIHQADDSQWTVGTNYHFHGSAEILGSTVNYANVSTSDFGPDVLTTITREFVVSFDSGYLRSCSSVSQVGAFYRFNFIDAMAVPPPTGSLLKVYTNRPPVGPTLLSVAGDATGSVLIKGGTATLNLTLNAASVSGRFVEFDTPGTYTWPVPAEVTDLFFDGGGAGGGAGGAGGGWNVNHVTNDEYRAGGGGGGGGAGQTEVGFHVTVTPGEILTIVVGAKGLGGIGGNAPGNNGQTGTAGGDTSISGSFGTITLSGGTPGSGGAGFGAPSGLTGAGGGPGSPGGFWGTDGYFGGPGGNGGSSPFGNGGAGARAATGPTGIPGSDATGGCSGGGGGSACYVDTATGKGGDGGDGTDGLMRIKY